MDTWFVSVLSKEPPVKCCLFDFSRFYFAPIVHPHVPIEPPHVPIVPPPVPIEPPHVPIVTVAANGTPAGHHVEIL